MASLLFSPPHDSITPLVRSRTIRMRFVKTLATRKKNIITIPMRQNRRADALKLPIHYAVRRQAIHKIINMLIGMNDNITEPKVTFTPR